MGTCLPKGRYKWEANLFIVHYNYNATEQKQCDPEQGIQWKTKTSWTKQGSLISLPSAIFSPHNPLRMTNGSHRRIAIFINSYWTTKFSLAGHQHRSPMDFYKLSLWNILICSSIMKSKPQTHQTVFMDKLSNLWGYLGLLGQRTTGSCMGLLP